MKVFLFFSISLPKTLNSTRKDPILAQLLSATFLNFYLSKPISQDLIAELEEFLPLFEIQTLAV